MKTTAIARLTTSPARYITVLLLAVVVFLGAALPAYAQSSSLEEADDANRTAKNPAECVRADPPDQEELSDVSRYLEANQAYEDCLDRTSADAPQGEQDEPEAQETGSPDPAAMNRNASTPEQCVEPDAPGENDDPDTYLKDQAAYEDCLMRTGPGDSETGEGGASASGDAECQKPPDDAPDYRVQEYEQCLASSGGLDNQDTLPGEASVGGGDDGGATGMVLGWFKGIMNAIWDWTFGWSLERMGDAFQTNLLSLPTLDGRSDLLGFYTGAVEKLRPAILVGILLLGILMMVRSDNYDLAYVGFQGLPRLIGIALALAFLPQFMGELSRITAGITEAFFPGGQDIDAAGQELFKAAVGNLVVTNFLTLLLLVAAWWVGMLVLIAALLNKILYATLFVAGAFALVASIVPSFYSLAGSWFRGVLASAAIPTLWSIELGIGTLVVTSPESIFGSMANSLGFITNGAVTSIGAIITMWVMYKTPFKCIEWAFNVQLPGRGGLVALAKTGAALAIAIPARTAVAQATRNLMSGTAATASTASSRTAGEGSARDGSSGGTSRTGMPGNQSSGAAARKIQQVRNQGQQARKAENLSKARLKYDRQQDPAGEGKEKFMQGRPRSVGSRGLEGNRSGDRSGKNN